MKGPGGDVGAELDSVEVVHLRAGGVSVVLEVPTVAVPQIVHWGPELTGLTADTLVTLCRAQEPPIQDADGLDASTRPGLIPLESDGWLGRPGLVGHRSGGRAWAPRLRTRSISADVVDLLIDEGARVVRPARQPDRGPGTQLGAGQDVGLSTDPAHGDALVNEEGESAPPASPVAVATGGAGTVTFHLVDDECALACDLTVELLPQGLLRLRSTATNTDADTPYELEELSLALPLPLTADEILDFHGRWGRERDPQRTPVRAGCHLREGRHGRTGFDAPGMMFCGPRGFTFERGRVWGLHVAHSGDHRTWIERMPTGVQVIGGGELLLPGEIVLEPGQSYTSPWIYAETADGLDEAARIVHRWERTLPSHPGVDRPVALNVWEAVYFDHDLETLTRLADRAAQIGVERYIVDDGWFLGRRDERRGLGDWEVDPDVWPQGLHPLVDHVRGLGMQFGLWFEPEMVSTDSKLAQAHPEWILAARTDALPVEKRFQQVLNLSIPEAFEHVRTQMDALIGEYHIDYIKWDHNRDLIDAGDRRYGGRAGVHEQTLACYRLMDRLRADHPGLEIESCSSGGGRIDLEMVRHAQRFWLSDCIDPVERQSIQRWSSQLVAPELMGTHVASERSHTTGRVADLAYRAATALWGHMGFEVDLLACDQAELAALREWVSFYRENREFLVAGDVVRRDVADGSLWLHGVVSPERDHALYGMSCVARSPMSPRGLMPLPGLEAGRRYLVRPLLIGGGPRGLILPTWGRGLVMDGGALAATGVHTPLILPDQMLIIDAKEVTQ